MENMIYPITVLGGLGLTFGVLLSIASNAFAVEIDPLVGAVLDALPGVNCGACGFPGCEGLANSIVDGKAPVTACPVGGQEVADKVANAMGLNAVNVDRKVAVVLCQGDCDKAKQKFRYEGINDCRIENDLADGSKACSFGCLGCGTCYDVCPFDAIDMVNGIAIINREKCTACMKCIEICPKNIIDLVPYDKEVIVKCISKDKGKEVRGYCSIGCIGCKICVKACPEDAYIFEDNLARIDYEKCTNCQICVAKCPTKCIHTIREDDEVAAN